MVCEINFLDSNEFLTNIIINITYIITHMSSSTSTILSQLEKKKQFLDKMLETRRDSLTDAQIAKINMALNIIVKNIKQHRHQTSTTASQPQSQHHYPGESEQITLEMAYKLFKIPQNAHITPADLKTKYHKLALVTHPDKHAGNSLKFDIVQKCYKLLMQFVESRTNPYIPLQQHAELKIDRTGAGFDLKKFNSQFEENRLPTPNDTGYSDWLKSEPENPVEDRGKLSKELFAAEFARHKSRLRETNAIQIYKEPEALVLSASNYAFILDDNADADAEYTKPSEIKQGGNYTDLKTAYTARGALIDPDSITHKSYNSIQEYERDRDNISYELTPEQEREQQLHDVATAEKDRIRLQRIREHDMLVEQHFNKVHSQMIGAPPTDSRNPLSITYK
jgi:curved DNA-binding protein CbpA